MERIKVLNDIYLIEFFAGIGSQAMALRDIGARFHHHKVVEFDKYPVASYNAIHGTNFEPIDITRFKGTDLDLDDYDSRTYMLTYSFPCQDLSVAGKGAGMKKGSATRSGLLWEVERILQESVIFTGKVPQILLMENVPQVHSSKNIEDFSKWLQFLESLGYKNYWQDLNAKDFGVAQSRNRCFCISLLGDYSFEFPKPMPLDKCMKDYLFEEVDSRYYVESEKARNLIDDLVLNGRIPREELDAAKGVHEEKGMTDEGMRNFILTGVLPQ